MHDYVRDLIEDEIERTILSLYEIRKNVGEYFEENEELLYEFIKNAYDARHLERMGFSDAGKNVSTKVFHELRNNNVTITNGEITKVKKVLMSQGRRVYFRNHW